MKELFEGWKELKSEWKIQIISENQFRLVKRKGERKHCEWKDRNVWIDSQLHGDANDANSVIKILKETIM